MISPFNGEETTVTAWTVGADGWLQVTEDRAGKIVTLSVDVDPEAKTDSPVATLEALIVALDAIKRDLAT